MMLEFDLTGGVDGFITLPVVFHRDVLSDKDIVEVHSHLVANHENPESIPLSGRVVRSFRWIAGIFLIVIETA